MARKMQRRYNRIVAEDNEMAYLTPLRYLHERCARESVPAGNPAAS